MCGTAEWEWEEDRFAYKPITVQCHGCYLKSVAEEGEQRAPGTRITLVPKALAQKLADIASEFDS